MAEGSLSRTRTDAEAVVRSYARAKRAHWLEGERVIERSTYWFFPVGYIGSCGVIIDKSDLGIYPMGSGCSLEDCFWGHERGFSHEQVVLRILRLLDVDASVEFLMYLVGAPPNRNPNPRRVWTRDKLSQLPFDCPARSLWLSIPAFRELESAPIFEYELVPAVSSPVSPNPSPRTQTG